MDRFEYVMTMLEISLGTASKRHIMGGALISVSLLFGGLALTVMTLKTEEKEENEVQVY
jgi:hypothetical protein